MGTNVPPCVDKTKRVFYTDSCKETKKPICFTGVGSTSTNRLFRYIHTHKFIDVATILRYDDAINAIKKHLDSEDKIMGCQNATPCSRQCVACSIFDKEKFNMKG